MQHRMGHRGGMKRKLLVVLAVVVVGAVVFGAVGCRATTHATRVSALGTPASTEAMLKVLDEPGPLELETVASADWVVDRGGLLNLDDPKAKAAGLTGGDEPIHVYFHVLRHPTRGTWWVDSGMEHAVRDDVSKAAVHWPVTAAMNLDKLVVHVAPSDWLRDHPEGVKGVLLTHAHLDHLSGVPDLPDDTLLYTGPGEAGARAAMFAFTQGTADRQLQGKPPLEELAFQPDPTGRFEGVIDVFGDGSLWALWVPGHTPGSVAYVARTTQGPVLLTGDTCHTRWGWDHEVEPGSFTADQAKNRESLARLERLAKEHPAMAVRLGHQ